MAPWLVLIVAFVYTYCSWDFYRDGQPGLSLAFAGYAISNVGLYWAAMTAAGKL
jgi:hypothetical protein